MISAQDRVVAYCKTITPDTDIDELLTFCGEICIEGAAAEPKHRFLCETLATAPVHFLVGRGGNVNKLVHKATVRSKAGDTTIRALLDVLKRQVSPKGNPKERMDGRVWVEGVCRLAAKIAEDLGDEVVRVYAEAEADRCVR